MCTYCGSGFILFMYVSRAFDTSDITNKLLKCNLMYWFELFFISFSTFDMVLYYICCKRACSMQHGPSTPPTHPGSCKTCFFRKPDFCGKSFLIFPIIDLIVNLKLICIISLSDLVNSLILPTAVLDDTFTHFGGFFVIFTGQLALKFH